MAEPDQEVNFSGSEQLVVLGGKALRPERPKEQLQPQRNRKPFAAAFLIASTPVIRVMKSVRLWHRNLTLCRES
jgi:hypothetical protein